MHFTIVNFFSVRESPPQKAQKNPYVPPSDEDWFDPGNKEIQWKSAGAKSGGAKSGFVVAVLQKKKLKNN